LTGEKMLSMDGRGREGLFLHCVERGEGVSAGDLVQLVKKWHRYSEEKDCPWALISRKIEWCLFSLQFKSTDHASWRRQRRKKKKQKG